MHLPSEAHGAVNARFVAGNPLNGQRATLWTADLCNAVVEEPANVIRAAGLELDRTDNTQLLQSLIILIKQHVAEELKVFGGAIGSASPVDPDIDPTEPPQPPAVGAYVIVNPNTSTVQMRIEGDAVFANGALTLTDAPLETYDIVANLLTITEA